MLIALVATGFAHQTLHSPESIDPEIQAYLEAGGSRQDLCRNDGDTDEELAECDACLLKNSFSPPVKSAPTRPDTSLDRIHSSRFVSQLERFNTFDLARASRAPPTVQHG